MGIDHLELCWGEAGSEPLAGEHYYPREPSGFL